MLVTLLKNQTLESYMLGDASLRYYARPIPDMSHLLLSYASWQHSDYSDNKAYYARLQQEPCYYLYPEHAKDRPSMDAGLPVPASLLHVVDAEQRGVHLRLVAPPTAGQSSPYHDALLLGQPFWAVAANAAYDGVGWFATQGLDYTPIIPKHCVIPYAEDWQSPYSLRVGKVVFGNGRSLPAHALGYYVPLLHNALTNQLNLRLGPYRTIDQPIEAFSFAQNEKEELIYARKAHELFRLLLSPEVASLLEGQQGLAALLCSMASADYNSLDPFRLAQGAPNYLAVDPADHTRVSFVPQARVARLLEQDKDPWTDGSRQSTSWGKLAKLLLNNAFYQDEKQYEDFSSGMVAMATDLYGPEEGKPELLIVRGAAIAEAYRGGDVIATDRMAGARSCMNSKPKSYFDVYAKNPDQVAMLICRERGTGLLHGRALLWTDVEGNKFLDRRYVHNPVAGVRMLKYATGLGYVDIWTGLSTHQPLEVRVQLAEPYHLHYPYVDSVLWLNPETGIMDNRGGNGFVDLHSQSGTRPKLHNEAACAQSGLIAPKSRMELTASGQHAFAKYLLTLRSGKRELEKNCVTDQLEGGFISKAEAVHVFQAAPATPATTSRGNPAIAHAVGSSEYFSKELLHFSAVDGGYIRRRDAVQQPDGGWCLPQSAARYQRMKARKKVNQALLQPQLAAETPQPPQLAVAA